MSPIEINSALQAYGASLDKSGRIRTPAGKLTSCYPILRDERLRFENDNGALLASGRPNAEFIGNFVERFWYWKKV